MHIAAQSIKYGGKREQACTASLAIREHPPSTPLPTGRFPLIMLERSPLGCSSLTPVDSQSLHFMRCRAVYTIDVDGMIRQAGS